MEITERLGELDHQASISASSTGRHQTDERDANKCCSDSMFVDEKNCTSALQIDLYFSHTVLFCFN